MWYFYYRRWSVFHLLLLSLHPCPGHGVIVTASKLCRIGFLLHGITNLFYDTIVIGGESLSSVVLIVLNMNYHGLWLSQKVSPIPTTSIQYGVLDVEWNAVNAVGESGSFWSICGGWTEYRSWWVYDLDTRPVHDLNHHMLMIASKYIRLSCCRVITVLVLKYDLIVTEGESMPIIIAFVTRAD